MRLNIHVRRFPISEIPVEEEAMYKWLVDRWVEKDALVQHLLDYGYFPNVLKEPEKHLDMGLK
jgi:lysocardiolipin and lysophospholipid acyltransferase